LNDRVYSNQKKPVLAIILGSQFHLRSFFSGDLHSTLSESFQIQLLVVDGLSQSPLLSGYKHKIIVLSSWAQLLFRVVLDASMVRNFWKSSSFRFRIRRMILGDVKQKLPFRPRGVIRLLQSVLLAMPLLYSFITSLYRLSVLQSLKNLSISEVESPQLVCAWAQSLEPTSMLAMMWARKIRVKSVLVFDNWDNLSSKAVLIDQPDAVVCFGPQSATLASRIHGISHERIYAIGSSRFDSYINLLSPSAERRSVLIAGSSLAVEDLAILSEMSSIWKRSSPNTGLRKFTISYRPHPAPQGLKIDFSNFAFSGITLSSNFMKPQKEQSVFQSQDSVVEELSRQRLVIGSPTTLIIEAMLLRIPVIVPTFGGDHVRTSNAIMLERLEHLKVIQGLKNVFICSSKTSLESMILHILDDSIPYIENDELDFIVTTVPGSFASRLNKTLMSLYESQFR
jgi:hypothetical protein